MATFTVWKYQTAAGGQTAVETLRQVRDEGLIQLEDYALIEWPAEADKPQVKYENRDDWQATGWGALLGAIFGALFFLPLVGAAAGALIGLVSKKCEAIGITKEQLERIGQAVTPGTSALFVVTTGSDLDRAAERFRGQGGTLIASNLVDVEATEVANAFEG